MRFQLFVEHFFEYFTEKYQKKWCRDFIIPRLTELAMEMSWPGNVRELMGWIEKFVVLEDLETACCSSKKEIKIIRSVPDDAMGKCIIIPEKEFPLFPEEVGFEKIPVEGGFVDGECFAPNCASGDFQPLSLSFNPFVLDNFRFLEMDEPQKKEALKKALEKNNGVVTAAGRDLGLPESSASYFVKKLGLIEYARELKKAAKKSEKSA